MITSSLTPLLGNSEWYQDVIQSQRIMDEVNKIILHWAQELNGKTIVLPYLDGLFENATHVREILALQELTPEFIELLMSLSMKPEKFEEFFMMDKPFATLCMNLTFAEFFNLPSESKKDISELQRAVCSVNLTAAERELYYLLQLDSITFKFMQIFYNDPSLGPYNWTASVILSQQVQEAIGQLVTGPPVFSVDSEWLDNTLSALKYAFEQQMTRFRDMFGQTDPQQSLENGLQELQTILNQYGLWYKVQPVLEFITLYLDLVVTQTEQNVENLKFYLNITIPPDVVADLTSMSVDEIKAYIISNFIPVTTLTYFHNNGLWDTVFCNETVFNQYVYILYDEVINATALRLLLCETNSTELFRDLQGYYGYDIIQLQEMIERIFGESPMTRDFDWQELIDVTQELTSLFEEIGKLPSFMHGSLNVSEIHGRLQALQRAIFEQNIETAMTLLYELGPLFDLEGLGFSIRELLDSINQQIETLQAWMGMVPSTNITGTSTMELLEMIESSLKEVGVWNEVRPVIEITNLLLGGANEWLYPLGLSPSQVFYNATVLSEVLTRYTDLTPALMETKAITDFVPLLQLAYIYNNDLWEEAWQCANYSEGFSHLGEYSNVIEMLCTLNETEFFEDVSGLLKVDILELEKQLSSLGDPSSGSNLTTIPLDWEELINNVQLFTNAQREILSLLVSMGHADSNSSTLSVVWQALENLDVLKTPMSGQILEMLASSLPTDDPFIRSYIPAITLLAEKINADFEAIRDHGISVTTFFELQVELMDLIQQILSESDLQAFLEAQINVEMLESITNFEDVAEIFCDEEQFSLLLTFPSSSEIDVEVIQRSLCDLVKSSNVTIQLGLYHYLKLGTIYQQAVKLYTSNNGAGFPQQDVDWEYTLGELEKVVNNFMNIQIRPEDWLTLLMQFSGHGMTQLPIPGSTEDMLTQIFAQLDVILMNNTVWHQVKGYIAAVTELAESINAEFVELRELGIDATTFFELQTDLMELIQKILSESELEALLQATINEEMLGSITNFKDVADIVCDEDQFNLLLTFPSTPEIDVGVIQRSLCDLIKSSNVTIQLGLYHYLRLGAIYQQMMRLFSNNYYRGFPFADIDIMDTLTELNILMANFISIDINQVWHVLMELMMEGDLLGGFPVIPVTNMPLSPTSVCEMVLPVVGPLLSGTMAETILVKSDLFMQVVNQLYFDLPDHEEEIQSLLNNQSLVGELMWTTFQVSSDALTALQGISRDMGQIYLLRALSLDIIEGNLRDVACSEQDLRDLLNISPGQDVSELSSLICSVDAIIQTELVQELLVIIDFESAANKIRIINGPAFGNLLPLSCSSLFGNGEEFVDNVLVLLRDPTAFQLKLEIPGLMDLIGDISTIIQNVTSGDYNSLQGLVDLVDELLQQEDFLSENGTARGVIDELLQLYDSYIDAINKVPGIIPVDSLWWNSSGVATLLLKETGLTVDDITMLMKGSINVTVIAELRNLTVLTWGSMVCDKEVFMRLLILSSDELKNLVYQETCLHPDKETLFDEISQRFNLFKFLVETSQSAIPVPTFVEFLQEILSRIEKLEKLNTTTLENLVTVLPHLKDVDDISDLMNIVPLLENLTLDDSSFEELFDNLRPILGSTLQFQQAKALFELLREKEYIVDVLREFPALIVEKMLKFPEELRLFLEEEIALTSDIVDRIFSALLNPELLLSANISNSLDSICSKETFIKYLDFAQGSNLTVVVDAICGQNISTIGEVLDILLGSYNTDGIINVLLSSGIIDIITNMTDSFQNITQSLGEIQQLQETMPTLLESASSLGEIFDEQLLEELSSGKISAFTLLQENSDLFCDNGGSSKRRRRRRQTLSSPSVASSGFCQDLYNSLQSGTFGEIQWAFVKPILLGKILYTPISPASEEIIKKANKPFEDLTEISEIARSWLSGVTELTNLLESPALEDIENLLGNAYISGLLETELAIDADALRAILQGDLTSIPVETLNQISVLAELVVNVTSCLELDRFMGFESEDEMEKYAARLNMDNLYLAGITFMDFEDATEVPKHVKYALRMDTDRTPSTELLMDIYWHPGHRGDFFTEQQYLQGFVFLQDMIERAIIELHATSEQLSDVYIQQMPYPCYKNDRYLFIASIIFPLLFTIGFLVLIAVMTHQLVYEKERGIEELMKVMGLRSGVNWFAWFFSNAVLLSVLMVVIAIILRIASIAQNTQFSVLIIFLWCFAFSLIMQSYMVSSFFQKANIASLGALLVYLILYVPYGFVFTRGGKVSVIGSLAVSLASPSAFSFGCLIISRYEHQGIGSSWGNIWENPRDEDHSTLAASCIMMVFDGLIYFIIGWYIRTVFPGKFGVPRPWYFPFQASYWCRGIRSDTSRYSTGGGEVNEAYQGESATPMKEMGTHVESEPTHAPVGIAIQNLSKVYGTRCPSVENRALDKMTLNFFEGQVTALLGSNGAGKTTVISIITGLYPASGGSVNIYDQEVGFNAGVRGSDLGLCPQHNALYDELTVKEHLKIFGKLKGMSKKALIEQGTMLLDELRLSDMLNVPVHKLSGGMKRKLCVAISLMGNAKTVILDEPTSGVDPHARRAVWDLIIRSKKDRTIVLCTHFMDEADLLGDRIAILDRGQLRCCGSSAFLKSKFTSGVKLTLSKERPSGSSTPQSSKKLAIGEGARAAKGNVYEDLPVSVAKEPREEDGDRSSSSSSSGVSSQRDLCDSAKVTQFLTSRVDGITLLKEVGSELVYQLPSTKEEKAKFPQLFRELDEQLTALHIRNYGVSDTNLEEVFLKVSTHSDSFMESNVDQSEDITEDPPKWNKNQNGQSNEVMFGGQFTSGFQQVLGIFLKRFHITRRDWRGFIWAVLMPVAMLAVGTVMAEFYPVPVFPPLQLTPAMFKDPNYVFFSNGETNSIIGERLTKAFLGAPGIGTTCMSDADEMDIYPCEFTEAFFPEPISGLTDDEKRVILEEDILSPLCVCEDGRSVCDEEAGGVAPPEWITNTSAILQDLSLKTDVTEYLLSTRQRYEQNRYGGVTFVDIKDGNVNRTVIKAWYSNIGYHALPTYINVANNALLRASLPAGSNPAEYGITAYNHPVELAEALPDITGWSIASVQFGLVLFLMTALAMVPATLSTLMVQENLNGAKRLHFVSGVTPARYWLTNLIWDMLIYIVPAVLIIIVLLIFGIEAFVSDQNVGTFILLLIVYGFAIFSQYYLLVPIFSDTGTAFVMYFCSNLILFLLTNLPTFLDYLQLANYQRSEALPVLNNIFLIFTPFCISSALLTMLYSQLEADIYASFGVERITDSLYMVRWNIIAMVIHTVVAMAVILLLEYRKKKRMNCNPSAASRSPYEQEDEDVEEERDRVSSGGAVGDVISLKDITKVYSVRRRKITAVDHISFGVPKGECFGLLGVNGAGKTTLFKTITMAIAPSDGTIQLNAKSIGYCPQVDAIYDQLTGEEILYCYARLKGIKEEYVEEVVEDITAKMGMGDFSRKVISTYSGGMKRTLSVAVSLLGDPQLVLMDEPTAGMDPVSKQAVWRGIQAAILDGRSVIVTSHSMEECENLCTRLAIMVNGQFRCLGSPQHVKHRHGEGYTLILHLLSGDTKSADLSSVARFMEATFPESVLKEHHLTMLRYQLSSTGFSLADIYEAVEKERDALGIEEYSVTQTTLDQVFVNFAKKQTDGHGDDTSSISSLGHSNPAFDPESQTVL
ncbi:ATP-binding cassette sub-family A member 1 [Holothuria leucospilota]|uniref:ATP-binding cassette sub-family A member 1 n=1 Tax=Holothuria leucospilota TaxID=206669 RepID=A0A9Q1BV44_HOLLE|nr:ATP-binding cassette sub-family A member 1 [Holothuria leucospilota]